uniref:Uncharacterized protein n=1 Tax=Gorilla gorilla gorilla TaxID=9595 RepID=A0A2I2ZXX7_GORGO
MPVIPALWEAEEGGSPEVRSSRPEAEHAVSRDRTIALQPGQQEQDSISNNNNKNPKGDSSGGRGQHLYTPSGSPLCVPLRRPPALPGPPLPAGLRLDRVLLHLW